MRFGSLFAGIGGFDVALERAGMECAWQVEIDDACRRVLARRWPDVPRYRDIRHVHNQRRTWCPNCLPAVDLLVGGFPCQDVSVAGRRAGLAGERSGLFYEFARLAAEIRPRWLLVENVPGLLSSNGGRDMGAIVGTLGELGYGLAWRVLDAQYFGVAQRRRRLFVVGCLGDPPAAAAVLLEPESCGGHPAPRRDTGTRAAHALAPGSGGGCGPDDNDARGGHIVSTVVSRYGKGTDSDATDGFVPVVTPCLPAYGGPRGSTNNPQFDDHAVVVGALTGDKERGGWRAGPDEAAAGHVIAHALRAEGADASEDGTGRGTPLVAVTEPLDASYAKTTDSAGSNGAGPRNVVIQPAPTCRHGSMACPECDGVVDVDEPVPVAWRGRGLERGQPGLANALRSAGEGHVGDQMGYVASRMSVRRLTPTECERLQGFPDGWTEELSDSARYRCLGNAVCVPVVEWIGRRVSLVGVGARSPNSALSLPDLMDSRSRTSPRSAGIVAQEGAPVGVIDADTAGGPA